MEIGTCSTTDTKNWYKFLKSKDDIKTEYVSRIRRMIRVLDPKFEWIVVHNINEERMELFIELDKITVTMLYWRDDDSGILDIKYLDEEDLKDITDMLEQILLETY